MSNLILNKDLFNMCDEYLLRDIFHLALMSQIEERTARIRSFHSISDSVEETLQSSNKSNYMNVFRMMIFYMPISAKGDINISNSIYLLDEIHLTFKNTMINKWIKKHLMTKRISFVESLFDILHQED